MSPKLFGRSRDGDAVQADLTRQRGLTVDQAEEMARNAWYPAPIGLKGKPLVDWVSAIDRADGRCTCVGKEQCGKPHAKTGGRCSHVHGQYQDKQKQLLAVTVYGEVLCPGCYRGVMRAEARANAAAAEGMEATLW